MENTYGIGVKNRYELFYDEDVDPLAIIREREAEKEKLKVDKKQTKEKTKTVKPGKTAPAVIATKKPKESPPAIAPKPAETTEVTNKPRTRPFADRNIKGPRNFDDSKDTEERKNFRNRDEFVPVSSEPRERDGEMRRGRGGGFRGRGRPRGRGNFFNSDNRPPRRDFDRQSGSDKSSVRPVDKKDSAGSNNWSDMRTDFNSRKREPDSSWDEEFESSGDKVNESTWESANETFAPSPRKEVPEEKTEESTNENTESKENEPVEERSDEAARQMTLDEWKKEQEAKRVVPKFNLRKPGEGEDGNQWKKLYMLKKKAKEDGDEEEDDEEDEDVDDEEFGRRGRHRQLVDIQINFNDSRRGGRGRARGGRGGGGIGPRSGGPVGNKEIHREERREPLPGSNVAGRSYRNLKMNKSGQQSAPRVDDWNDFPSLVKV